ASCPKVHYPNSRPQQSINCLGASDGRGEERRPSMLARPLCATLSLAAVACGNADNTSPTPVGSVAGVWQWLATGSNSPGGITCGAAAQLTLDESGTVVNGTLANATVVCQANGHAYQVDPGSGFSGGVVSGDTSAYRGQVCRFTGKVSGSP